MADLQQQEYPGKSLDNTATVKNTKPGINTRLPGKQTQTQTQKTVKNKPAPSTRPKITNPATQKKQSMFLPTSRLNRGQRKYCHCLMAVRSPKQSPYGICSLQSFRTMKANPGQRALRFIPRETNCIMNYDYTQYTLADVQNLAVERGIPLANPTTGKQNNKTSLVQLLTNRYINKHRRRKTKN